MNKKLFLGMLAAVGMLLATSCSNDELNEVQPGNEAQVTFSLGLEGGIATRAISDGTSADKLVYAVYKLDDQGTPVLQPVTNSDVNSQIVKQNAFQNGLTETVTVQLAKGQTYQIAFWAQDDDCNAYDTDDLQNVKIDYENAANNDETRDAFFKMVEFSVEGDKVINDITLERPFAQINVGVYQQDWTDAVNSGIEIEKSTVTIEKAANCLNLLTGGVSGEETVVYAMATIPAQLTPEEVLYVDLDKDGTKEAYKYLSMSYILANDLTTGYAKTTLESLDFTFAPKCGNNIELHNGLNAVPVRRNWRTNIIGTILTGDIEFNITIDPGYDGDYNPMDQLKEILTNGGKITLFSDVTLTEPFTIPAEANVEIDLNGNTLNVETKCTVEGNLSIGNGKINVDVDGEGDLLFAFVAEEGSTIDLSNADVTVADKNAAVVVAGNDVNVNLNKTTMDGYNGIFAYPSALGDNWYNNLKITLTESTITGEPALYLMYVNATVILDGKSSAKVFGVYGGDTKVDVVYAGNKPEVIGDGTANDVTYYTTDEYLMREALANGGDMVLSADLTLTKSFAIAAGKEANIDLAGYTLTLAQSVAVEGELNITNGAIVTDMDNRGNAFETKGADAVLNFKDVQMTVTGNNNGITVEPWGTVANTAAVVNLDNTQINVTGTNGHAIFVTHHVKNLEINVTNNSEITGNQAIFIEKADDAVINIDATSYVDHIHALYGNVNVICLNSNQPETHGSANFTTYASESEFKVSETFANGGILSLIEDVTLSSGMEVAAGVDAKIALNDNALNVGSQNTVLGNLTISDGDVNINVQRIGNATVMGFLADNGSEINIEDATIDVERGNMAFAIFNETYNYASIRTKINLNNSEIKGDGHGISSPFGADYVEINLTNSTINSQAAGVYLMNVKEAVIIVDATSSVNKITIEGSTKLTVKYPAGSSRPTVTGAVANVTYVEY